jgi:uncharacterized protein YbjT (DUF2867 family)
MTEALDLPATILRPAYFIQNDVRLKDPLLKSGVYGMQIGAKGVSMVDSREIGEAAANELDKAGADPTLNNAKVVSAHSARTLSPVVDALGPGLIEHRQYGVHRRNKLR